MVMHTLDQDSVYARVPREQREMLGRFRAEYPYREVGVGDTVCRYIACGEGERTLLLLAGGFWRADMWFRIIPDLERDYRILAPDCFFLNDGPGWINHKAAFLNMLAHEGVDSVSIIGLSAGAGLAQSLVQSYPERAESLVLSHCGALEGGKEFQRTLKRMLLVMRVMPFGLTGWIMSRKIRGPVPASSAWGEFREAWLREGAAHVDRETVMRFPKEGIDEPFVHRPEVIADWPGRVLILNSRDDHVTVGDIPRLQTMFPQASVHMLDEGGDHTCMLFSEEYAAALRRFLDG